MANKEPTGIPLDLWTAVTSLISNYDTMQSLPCDRKRKPEAFNPLLMICLPLPEGALSSCLCCWRS